MKCVCIIRAKTNGEALQKSCDFFFGILMWRAKSLENGINKSISLWIRMCAYNGGFNQCAPKKPCQHKINQYMHCTWNHYISTTEARGTRQKRYKTILHSDSLKMTFVPLRDTAEFFISQDQLELFSYVKYRWNMRMFLVFLVFKLQ